MLYDVLLGIVPSPLLNRFLGYTSNDVVTLCRIYGKHLWASTLGKEIIVLTLTAHGSSLEELASG